MAFIHLFHRRRYLLFQCGQLPPSHRSKLQLQEAMLSQLNLVKIKLHQVEQANLSLKIKAAESSAANAATASAAAAAAGEGNDGDRAPAPPKGAKGPSQQEAKHRDQQQQQQREQPGYPQREYSFDERAPAHQRHQPHGSANGAAADGSAHGPDAYDDGYGTVRRSFEFGGGAASPAPMSMASPAGFTPQGYGYGPHSAGSASHTPPR